MNVAPLVLASCSWMHPGAAPYDGSIEQALRNFPIPLAAKAELLRKASNDPHSPAAERVTIGTDMLVRVAGVERRVAYMHFAHGQLCTTVSRTPVVQPAAAYCSGAYCVVRPDVCGNWSLLPPVNGGRTPLPGAVPVAGTTQEPVEPSAAALPPTGISTASEHFLDGAQGFDAPGAGPVEPIVGYFPPFLGEPGFGGGGVGGGGFGPTLPPPNGGGGTSFTPLPPVSPIPEPALWKLLSAGFAGLIAFTAWKRWLK